MTLRSHSAAAHNPLRHLPSVLAMHDVQARVHRVLGACALHEPDLVAALQLDPLAVLRGLRAAHAPVFRRSPAPPSVRGMVQTLGLANSRRLLACEPKIVPAASPLRTLWRHAVATALAAQDLANHTGLIDPEAAYMLGLLCDLPRWLAALRPIRSGDVPLPTAAEYTAYWQLPTMLVSQLHAARTNAEPASWLPTDVTSLLRAARRLAALAGWPLDAAAPTAAAERVDTGDREAIERLRQRFAAAFTAIGLGAETTGDEPAGPPQPRLAGQRRGSLDDVVLGILGCTQSDTYRGIVTALTAAALRYGDYDRVFFARWLPQSGVVNLRSKADASSRRIVQRAHQTTAAEAQALQTALREDRPVVLEAPLRSATGLLAALSTDDLIAMPMNGSFQQPSFLLLDRALTQAPIDLYHDGAMAITLGKMASLLHENLLLRRRRQRAQKFALTDPLTRLFNRRMGLLSLEQELARCERATRPMTVLMCDLDHFKQLNDTLGHLQGDHALRATAEVLRQTLRKGDTVCRYGGEEFLIVLPDTTAPEATVLAARLFTTVHRTGEELGLPITISIGLTTHRAGDTVETILHRADHALYASKGYGRNRFSADVDGAEEVWPARAPT